MSKPIVALNSGGFDSVLMLKLLREENPKAEITTLFFDYGQKNVEQEGEKSLSISTKLGCNFKRIKLPKFDWTSGEFYQQGFNEVRTEYLEMRNLVFISYGLSFCESIGADELYVATLKSNGYFDTSKEFIDGINSIAIPMGIEVRFPFTRYQKHQLDLIAYVSGIGKDDFFSCDNPVEGKPCGKCPDCLAVEALVEHATINTPVKAWNKCFDPYNETFQDLIKSSSIYEMRVLVNNDCQLKCEHCFYGFDEMCEERLSLDEYREVFKQATSLGINKFHFSGKEPLFDDFIFEVVCVLREVNPGAKIDVVTNGINVPKYAQKMKAFGFEKVYLSIDSLDKTNSVRNVSNVYNKAILALQEIEIPIQVFIDVHEYNKENVLDVLTFLHKHYGIDDFYVRTIIIVGSAKKNGMKRLDLKTLNFVYEELLDYSNSNKIMITFAPHAPEVYDILGSTHNSRLKKDIVNTYRYASSSVTETFSIYPEFYCGKYESQITLTPDGFLLGCGAEVSDPNYQTLSSGNVRDKSLKELINIGKLHCIASNCKEVDSEGNLKYYDCTSCNPID